jgi:hypothetical protein
MRSMSRHLAALAVLLTVTATAGPVSAITYGDPDGDAHPYVGLLVTRDANGFSRCSGTLVSPTLLVTAGHCTDAITEPVQVWFEPGPIEIDPAYKGDGNCAGVHGYPCEGDVSGTAHTYPHYDPADPTKGDLGVVVLDQPIELSAYGRLPDQDQLDTLAKGQQLTAAGYGQQRASKSGKQDVVIRERMVAHPALQKINEKPVGDYGFLTSQNASTGGVCLGDSGGPMFLDGGTVIAGVVSYVTNDSCKGSAGSFRLDRAGPLSWLQQELATTA